jgi:hypothetical protein
MVSKKSYKLKKIIDDCIGYEALPSVLPAVKNIYAIGDIHGDLKVAIDSLHLSKVINKDYKTLKNENVITKKLLDKISEKENSNFTSENMAEKIANNLKWTGSKSVVVQVGDQVDRCRPKEKMCNEEGATVDDEPSDLLIMYLMTSLDRKARKSGGMIISLFGNHEIMQTFGNFNYVSKKNLDIFENEKKRIEKFSIGNKFSKFMACTRLSSVIIGSNIFIHAGIIPSFFEHSNKKNVSARNHLKKINDDVRKYLLDKTNPENIKYVLKNRNSIFWTRVLGGIPPNIKSDNNINCAKYLEPVLKLLNCKNMIVGHTPQSFQFSDHGINSTCIDEDNNGLHKVDVGSSKAFQEFDNNFSETSEIMESRDIQVLNIINDSKIKILKLK